MITPQSPTKQKRIFDTHAHYDDAAFDGWRDELLPRLKSEYGVCAVINCGCDKESSQKSLALAEKYDFIYAAVGIHPELAGKTSDTVDDVRILARHKKAVAIGEIGLDYHWHPEQKEAQIALFTQQILLANELHLPVIVHDREAHADTMELLNRFRPAGVLHCFSGSEETAELLTANGMYLGVGGALTFKNARKLPEIIRAVPLAFLLLETDAPYMAPEPFRGQTNHSGLICEIAQRIAAIKEVSVDTVFAATRENAEKLFFKK